MKCLVGCLIFFSHILYANEQSSPIKINQLSDNVYQHISYKNVEPYGLVGASGLVVVDGNDAYLIDTPWTDNDTHTLIDWVEAKGLTVKGALATHFHEDASGGILLLNEMSIATYATTKTNLLLNQNNRQSSSNEISTNKFELLSGIIEVFYPGAGHSPDNIVVWLPEDKILFGGCFVKSLSSKSLGYTGDASIKEWPKSIENVSRTYPDIEVVVPGHGKVGNISLLSHTAKLALEQQKL